MLRHACQLIYGSLFLTPELGMRQLFSLTTTPHFNRASGTKNYWKNVTVSVSKWSIYIVLRIRMWNVYSDTHEGFRQKYATVSGIPQNFSCRLKQKDKILFRMGVTSASHLSSTSTSSSWWTTLSSSSSGSKPVTCKHAFFWQCSNQVRNNLRYFYLLCVRDWSRFGPTKQEISQKVPITVFTSLYAWQFIPFSFFCSVSDPDPHKEMSPGSGSRT